MKITNTKEQIPNGNRFQMECEENRNRYDLEERTFQFAKSVCNYTKRLKKTVQNIEYIKQVIKSSASSGANYIEANEKLSKSDFIYRIKICRKEAKESAFWLRLIVETNEEEYSKEGMKLFNEAIELKKIFSAIIKKSE